MILALLEFAFVVLLSRAPGAVKKNIHGGVAEKRVHPVCEGLRRRKIGSLKGSKDQEQLKERNMMKVTSNTPPIHVVDLASFCIYIFLFISFNVIYWIYYQM